MEITGSIKMIGMVQDVSPTFRKRDVVITTQEQYPQHILVEFSQDKCDVLNGYKIGQMVKVGINLRGREWTNPQGETRYFNSIQGWRIDNAQQQGYGASGYQGQGSAVNAYMNQPPQQSYGQPQGYAQPQQGYGQPQQQGFHHPQYQNQQPHNPYPMPGAPPQQGYANPQGQAQQSNFPPAPDFGNQEDPDDLPF